MSVIRLDLGSELIKFYGGQHPEVCSYCGAPLADPVVHWSTPGGVRLWLHAKCAHTLALSLLFDAERALRLARGQAIDAGIESGLLP